MNFPPSDSYYWHLSTDLLRFGTLGFNGIKTTGFEPLYPLFLAFARWITFNHQFLVLTFQILVGTIGCLYLYELANLLSGNKRVALFASLIYSFYPYLIYQAGMISETTLFSTWLIITAYYYSKTTDFKNVLLCGVFFGLSILTRTTALPILFLASIALAIQKLYRQTILIFTTAVLMLLPLLIRNYRIDGSLFLTRSGENLFDSNCKYSDKLIPAYSIDFLYPYVLQLVKQERPNMTRYTKEWDQFFKDKAIQFIKENPGRIFILKLKNIFYLFSPHIIPHYPANKKSLLILEPSGTVRVVHLSPRSPIKELTYSIPYVFVFLTAVAGIYLRRKEFQRDLILYLIVFSFIAVHSLYFPTTRLRTPMDFVLIFYSACAIEIFLKRFKFR